MSDERAVSEKLNDIALMVHQASDFWLTDENTERTVKLLHRIEIELLSVRHRIETAGSIEAVNEAMGELEK